MRFVRRGCHACKYASAQFRRLAEDMAAESVRFFEMDIAHRDTIGLSRDLGVTAVPTSTFTPSATAKIRVSGASTQLSGPPTSARCAIASAASPRRTLISENKPSPGRRFVQCLVCETMPKHRWMEQD